MLWVVHEIERDRTPSGDQLSLLRLLIVGRKSEGKDIVGGERYVGGRVSMRIARDWIMGESRDSKEEECEQCAGGEYFEFHAWKMSGASAKGELIRTHSDVAPSVT